MLSDPFLSHSARSSTNALYTALPFHVYYALLLHFIWKTDSHIWLDMWVNVCLWFYWSFPGHPFHLCQCKIMSSRHFIYFIFTCSYKFFPHTVIHPKPGHSECQTPHNQVYFEDLPGGLGYRERERGRPFQVIVILPECVRHYCATCLSENKVLIGWHL